MFTRSFWIGAAERGVRAAVGAALVLLTADASTTLFTVEPLTLVGAVTTAAVVSVLTSLASVPFSGGDSSSFLPSGR